MASVLQLLGQSIFLLFLLKVFEVDDWLQERGGVKCALMLVVGGVVSVAVIRWIGDALGGMDTGVWLLPQWLEIIEPETGG